MPTLIMEIFPPSIVLHTSRDKYHKSSSKKAFRRYNSYGSKSNPNKYTGYENIIYLQFKTNPDNGVGKWFRENEMKGKLLLIENLC